MPDTFTLVFRDPDRDILGKAGLEIGTKVEISTTRDRARRAAVPDRRRGHLDRGRVRRARHAGRGPRLRQVAPAGGGPQDARRSSTSKYSDIATQIAGACGPHARRRRDRAAPSTTCSRRTSRTSTSCTGSPARSASTSASTARRCCSRSPSSPPTRPGAGRRLSDDDPHELVWGSDLLEFRARMSAVAQVSRGRGPRLGPEGEGGDHRAGATSTATNAELLDDARRTSPTRSAARRTSSSTTPVGDQQDGGRAVAEAAAAGRLARPSRRPPSPSGRPTLKAGVAVSIAGVDPALDGQVGDHRVAPRVRRRAVPHARSSSPAARTGRSTGSVSQGGAGGGGDSSASTASSIGDRHRQRGPRRASGGSRSSSRGSRTTPSRAGRGSRRPAPASGYGVIVVPQVDDEVLVAFEHGDMQLPVVLGGLWNGQGQIPFDYDERPRRRQGHLLRVHRRGPATRSRSTRASSESSIQLADRRTARSTIVARRDRTQAAQDRGQGQARRSTPSGDVEIKAGGSMKLEATGQMTIKGATGRDQLRSRT